MLVKVTKSVKMQKGTPAVIAYRCYVPNAFNLKRAVPECHDYLKWLRDAHKGAHVVAIVTQDKVP